MGRKGNPVRLEGLLTAKRRANQLHRLSCKHQSAYIPFWLFGLCILTTWVVSCNRQPPSSSLGTTNYTSYEPVKCLSSTASDSPDCGEDRLRLVAKATLREKAQASPHYSACAVQVCKMFKSQ